MHQDLGLVEQLSTVDNLALDGGYPLQPGRTIRWREAARRSRAAMVALGYKIDVNIPVGMLSAAERTGVAIARALQGWSGKPAVVVLDEPTAAMPAPEVHRLFEAIEQQRGQGLGILYVTHNLCDEVLQLANDVTVLRNGEAVMSRDARGLTHEALVTAIVGRELAATQHPAPQQGAEASRPAVLEIQNLRTPNVHGVSFTVNAGEIVGLAGITGSGRDDVLPSIAGAIARDGTVGIGRTVVPPRRPRAAIRAGLGFVPANRRRAAVLPTFDAATNLTVASIRRFVRFGLLNQRAEAEDALTWLHRLNISARESARSPSSPSAAVTGRRSWSAAGCTAQTAVLALDEPTQGVDIGACKTIYLSLQRAAEAGNGVLISSSDADELAAICHRVVVFVRGRDRRRTHRRAPRGRTHRCGQP